MLLTMIKKDYKRIIKEEFYFLFIFYQFLFYRNFQSIIL